MTAEGEAAIKHVTGSCTALFRVPLLANWEMMLYSITCSVHSQLYLQARTTTLARERERETGREREDLIGHEPSFAVLITVTY